MREGWTIRPLEEIADQCLGKMLDKSKNRGTAKPYLRNLNVRWFDFDLSDVSEMRFEDDERQRYTAVKGDVLICEGGYPGRAAIWPYDEPVYLQKAIHRVRFQEPDRAKWFLYYLYLSNLDGSLRHHFTGTGIQHFTGQALKRFRIPLPPLPEQQRIVAILDEAFDGLATATTNAEKNLKNAKTLFDSYLNSIFLQENDGWLEKTIFDVCIIGDGNHSSKYSKNSEMVSSGVPFIRSTNLANGTISDDDILYITKEKHLQLKKGHLKIGDVLFTNRGEIGKLAIVDERFNNANLNSQIAWLRCGQEITPKFLFYFLQSGEIKKHFSQTKSGAALQQFTIGMLRAVPVSFPPIDMQLRITHRLDEIYEQTQHLQIRYNRKLASIAELKQAILQKAFSGELASSPLNAIGQAAE